MQKLRGSGFHFLLQAALHGRSVDRLVQRSVVMRELSNTEEPPPSWRAVAGPVRDSLLTKNEETNYVELMPHKRFHQIDDYDYDDLNVTDYKSLKILVLKMKHDVRLQVNFHFFFKMI